MTKKEKRFRRKLRKVLEAVERVRNADKKAVAFAEAHREFSPERADGAFAELLRSIERSNLCLSVVEKAAKFTDDERAIKAQVLTPKLAGMTPGSVYHRHRLGE